MCLAIPGKILEIQELGPLRAARVQFGGIVRQVSLSFVPEAGLGDYVMVHVGFAISRVDAAEASAPTSFSKKWERSRRNCRQPKRSGSHELRKLRWGCGL